MSEGYYFSFWSTTHFKKRREQMERLDYLFEDLRKRRFRQKAD